MAEWMVVHSARRLTQHLFELRDNNRTYSLCGMYKHKYPTDIGSVKFTDKFRKCWLCLRKEGHG